MKLKNIKLYQPVQIGQFNDSYFSVERTKHRGLELDLVEVKGMTCIRIALDGIPDPVFVAQANIMLFVEDGGATIPKKAVKGRE